MAMTTSEIYNFVQLTPRIGTSGQPTAGQFATIAAAGYKGVINLAMPDSENAVADEGSKVSEQGMTYVHLPVPFDAPTAAHLAQFSKAMAMFDGQKVWVHCAMNLRVSAFMYHYLTQTEGLEESAARSPVLAKWEPRMDAVWQQFLRAPVSAAASSSSAEDG